MKTEARKMLDRWYILGAIGGILMAAGDWLLGCIPIEGTDTGMFRRAYYLSGAYGLWRPVLIVGMGAIGSFLYYFMVKTLNAGIDETCRKTRSVQYLCGIFTVAVALAIHLWPATLAWFRPIWARGSARRPPLPRLRPIRTICSSLSSWMSVMSQSSTNTAIVLWCAAAAVYEQHALSISRKVPPCG